MSLSAIRGLFAIAALYDGVLGLLFLIAPKWPYKHFEVAAPNHLAYVQFPAALLIIFGLMFLNISCNPRKHASLIQYGILLKIAYCGVAFGYWFSRGIPIIWKPFAVIDLVMLVLFVWAWMSLGRISKVAEN